uniref:LRR-RLK n=2 Tax=Rhizophora mucronata TaxID=61149 RepID=A0A2P2LC00_RHIMU
MTNLVDFLPQFYQVIKCICYTDFIPTVSNKPPSSKKDRTSMIVGIIVGVGIASFLLTFLVFFVVRRQKRKSNFADEGKQINCTPYISS